MLVSKWEHKPWLLYLPVINHDMPQMACVYVMDQLFNIPTCS